VCLGFWGSSEERADFAPLKDRYAATLRRGVRATTRAVYHKRVSRNLVERGLSGGRHITTDQLVVIASAPSEPFLIRGDNQRRMEGTIDRIDDKTEVEDDRLLHLACVGVWAAPGPHQAEKRRDSMRTGTKRAQRRTPGNLVPGGVSA
jgi:hypothetical protein